MNAQSFLYHAKDVTGISFRAASIKMDKKPFFIGNLACEDRNYRMDNLVSIANIYGYKFTVREDATGLVYSSDVNDVLLYICKHQGISTNLLSHKIGNLSDTLGATIRRGSYPLLDTYIKALDAIGYTAEFYNEEFNDLVVLDNKPSTIADGLYD